VAASQVEATTSRRHSRERRPRGADVFTGPESSRTPVSALPETYRQIGNSLFGQARQQAEQKARHGDKRRHVEAMCVSGRRTAGPVRPPTSGKLRWSVSYCERRRRKERSELVARRVSALRRQRG